MSRIKVLTILVAALALTVAMAQNTITLTFAHVDPTGWQTSKKQAAALMFKNMVEGESGGRIQVKVYPNGQLGGETQLVQSVQDGTLDMAMVSGAMSQVCPQAAVLAIPYMFPSAPVAWQVLDGSFGKKLAAKCLQETGLRTLAYGETGFRNFTNSKHPIKSPADLKGLKIRVQNTPLYVKLVQSLGGDATPLAWAQLPTALATHVVDGEENPIGVIYNNKLYHEQKYLTLDRHVYATDFIVISNKVFEKLSPADQNLVQQAAIVAGTMGRAIQEFDSAQDLPKLEKAGMQVYKPTAAEMKEFKDAAQPAIIKMLDQKIDPSWITDLQSAVKAAESNSNL